ncbi:unnamed protein product [Rotaria socialis]
MADEQPKSTYVILPENPIKNLTVAEMYDKEKYDLSTMEEGDVFTMLNATRNGLTEQEVNERFQKFGHNRLEHKETSAIMQFLLFMWNPLSWVMEAAAIVAIVASNGGGQPPDWEDFVGIILLLLANSIIGFVEQRNAGNAVKALMASLAPEAKVKRNGEWKVIDAADLVPGDIISVKLGDVIPADARLVAAHGGVSIDQAALTGESLPVNKVAGDEIFSGSTCKQGEAEAIGSDLWYALRAYFDPIQKRAIEELLTPEPSTQAQTIRRKSTLAAAASGPLSRRSTMARGEGSLGRRGTFIEGTAKYYTSQTEHLSTSHLSRNFARMLKSESANAPRFSVDHDELRRFSLVQAHHASKLLNPAGTNTNRRITTAL